MAVTLSEVADLAGVSRSAVSRCFTPRASVSAEMRARVMSAAEALRFRPNLLARSPTTRQTGMVGLVLNNLHNPVFLQIFDLVTRGLLDRGLRPLLVNLSDETNPQRSVQLLQQYSADGVVVASSELPNTFAESFKAAGILTVLAFGRGSVAPGVDVISIDNHSAGHGWQRRPCWYEAISIWGLSADQNTPPRPKTAGRASAKGQGELWLLAFREIILLRLGARQCSPKLKVANWTRSISVPTRLGCTIWPELSR